MAKSTPKSALHLEDLLQQMDKDAKVPFQGLHFSTPGMLARRAACGPSAVGKFAAPVPSQQEISVLFQGISVRQRALPVHHTEYDLHDFQHGRRMSSATSTTCCTTLEHGIPNLRYTRLRISRLFLNDSMASWSTLSSVFHMPIWALSWVMMAKLQ